MGEQSSKKPDGWSTKKIKQLCGLGRGRVISEDEIRAHLGVYPVYSSQTANQGEMGKIDTYDFEGEYVTWTTDGAYAGTVFYRSGKFNCTNVCGTLKAKNASLSLKYLAYALSTKTQKHVSYVGNPKLMNNIMAEIELTLPDDVNEQSKIAEILTTIDEAIDKTESLIQKYQCIKQGLMQDLFTKGIDENGNIRDEKTHKFKDSPLGRIPEEWEVKKLSEAIGRNKNQIVAGPFGSNLKVSDYIEEGIPLIRLQNIDTNCFIDKDIKHISEKKFKELSYHSFMGRDIVLAKLGDPIGKTCIVPFELPIGIVVADVVRIRVNNDYSDRDFIVYALNSPWCRKQLNTDIIGTTRPRVNLNQVRNVNIIFPQLSEQKQIASILLKTDKKISTETICKEKLLAIKHGLMEDLLTGTARVNHLIGKN